MFPGGLKERKFKDLLVKKPDDVRDTPTLFIQFIALRIMNFDRLSAKQSLVCFPKTSCETGGWSGYESSPRMTWVLLSTTS